MSGGRAAVFGLIFAVLQLAWQGLRGTAAEHLVVHDLTVRPAVCLVNLLTPEVHASAVGASLRAPGGGLNILNGCEGIEALFLLFAACAVAPVSWRARATGFLLGSTVVYAVNQARILALFYAYRADRALFDPLHATITPIAVVLSVCAYFYAWLSYARPRRAAPG